MGMFASGEQILSAWYSEELLFECGGTCMDQFHHSARIKGVGVYGDGRETVKVWDNQFFREERVISRETVVFEAGLAINDVFKIFGVSKPGGFNANGVYWRDRLEVDVLKLSGTSGVYYHWAVEANAYHRDLLLKWARASAVANFPGHPRNLADIDGEVAKSLRSNAKAHARLKEHAEYYSNALVESREKLAGILEYISESGIMSLFEAMAPGIEDEE